MAKVFRVDSVRSAIKELEHYGYVKRNMIRNEYGLFTDTEYIIWEIQSDRKMSSPYWKISPTGNRYGYFSPTENQCWKIQYRFFQGNK